MSEERIDFDHYWVQKSVPERLAFVAEKEPHLDAIVMNEESISFGALRNAVLNIARDIQEQSGMSMGTVALLQEHGPSLIVSLLAVLQAGKRYVALDSTLQSHLLQPILEHAESELLIWDTQAEAILSESGERHQGISALLDFDPAEPQPTAITFGSDRDAILFYTSGSTGEPKAVLESHADILHRAWTDWQAYGYGPSDRIACMFRASFAASLGSIFSGLLTGATVLPFDVRAQGFSRLAAWLKQERITVFNPPLAVMRAFLESQSEALELPDLRLVILGGDRLYRRDIDLMRGKLHGNYAISHQYACTEANIVTRWIVQPDEQPPQEVLPVGIPDAEKEVTIVDEQGVPLPAGEVGEIQIRSRVLVKGYWKPDDSNAHRFVPDPAGGDQRTYLTDDLGYLEKDGLLYLAGRKDSQIKILGQRVLLGEVELILRALEGVRAAVTVTYKGKHGDTSLAAYLVPEEGVALDEASVRTKLQDQVPPFMVPSTIEILTELPLMESGKIDRGMLAARARSAAIYKSGEDASISSLEQHLLRIWETVLNITPIQEDDNFFELGGNSLLALTLFSKIEQVFNLRLPVASLFENPTVTAQAALIRKGGARSWPSLVGVHPQGDKPAFFCASPTIIDVLAYRGLALAMDENQPFYAFYSHALHSVDQAQERVAFEAQSYTQELKNFQPHGPYFLGGYSNGGKIALEMAARLREAGEEVPLVVLIDTYGPDYRQLRPLVTPSIYRWLQWVRRLQMKVEQFIPWILMHWRTLSDLSWRERWQYLRYKGERRLLVTRKLINRSAQPLLSAVLNNPMDHAEMSKRTYKMYKAQTYDGKVVILRAEKQPLGILPDTYLGWRRLLTGELEVCIVPGYHDSLLFGPRVQFLAQALQSVLDREAASLI